MVNLMIFLNPSKSFTGGSWGAENDSLIKIQIENSLALGWKPEDIVLVTNFYYEYKGIKSTIIDSECFCQIKPTATKILAILHLFEKGFFGSGVYWFHDLDAFQLEKITEDEINLGSCCFALTDYGKSVINEPRSKRWSTGSIFFTKDAKRIFELIKEKTYQYGANEEIALLALTRRNKENINAAIKKLNITYNLATRKRDVSACWQMAEKPLKVIHFHPFDKRDLDSEPGRNNIDVCVYGKNKLGRILVNERLVGLFADYGVI